MSMNARVRKRSDAGQAVSSRDSKAGLTSTPTVRPVARRTCIGDMEEELHKAFATARVSGGSDFVYERDHDAYTRLDEFCNWNQMSEPALPLVVSGPSGSGKSALLSNWLLHYRRRLELRPKHGGPLEEPFIFCHAVGCTRHGVDVNQLLWRLLADLKHRFDLSRTVPNEAERLSWELPRFLDLARRKGRVIIVIDGLHRLQDKHGAETGLQWLPLRVPGNIRVIVSATQPDSKYNEVHEQRVRQHMTNPHRGLAVGSSREISFERRQTIASDSGNDVSGETKHCMQAREGGEAEYESSHRRRKVLMELSRRKWPRLELGPLETWRKRDVVEAYLKRSLKRQTCPNGGLPRPTSCDDRGAGADTKAYGLATFLTGVDFVDEKKIGIAETGSDPSKIPSGDRPGLMLFPSMVQSIISSDATMSALFLRTLLRALDWAAASKYDVRAMLTKILNEARSVRALYDVLFNSIESGNHPTEASQWAAEQSNKADGGLQALQDVMGTLAGMESGDSSSSNGVAEAMDSHGHERHQRRTNLRQTENTSSIRGLTNDDSEASLDDAATAGGISSLAAEKIILVRSESHIQGGEKQESSDRDDDDDAYTEDSYDDDELVDSTADASNADHLNNVEHVVHKKGGNNGANLADVDDNNCSGVGRCQARGIPDGTRDENGSGHIFPALPEHNNSVDRRPTGSITTEGSHPLGAISVFEIPVYLTGGCEVEGFGVTIGRAMALLHVVRHGLRGPELWSLLAALKASTSAQEEAEGTEGEAESRLLRKLLKNQNRLIDSIRSMDTDRDGVISTSEFRSAIIEMNVGLTEKQVEKLIRSIDVDHDGELDMQEMIERFSTTARKMKRGVGGGRKSSQSSPGMGEQEGSTEGYTEDTEEDISGGSSIPDGTKDSLKAALSVLGVSHDGVTHNSEEHNVFVLGLDAEDLREVVFRRYVVSASMWHSRLVRYFQAQSPSPRRCEELPWHLNKCYRWHPLKNTLVDLRTFETMWTTTQLKRELMEYWKLLTEGPLHTSEEAAAADLRNDSKSRLLSLMMQESCNRGEGGTPVSAADIIAVGNNGNINATGKVAPFDLVFEYNHAVEGWQAFSRPTISRLGEVVHTIGDFMREMSQLVQKEYASPPFLHMPLDFKELERVGIDADLVALTGSEPIPTACEVVAEDTSRRKDTILSKPKGAPKDKLSHYRVAPFYYFQRWLWVQFPWMALAGSGVGSAAVLVPSTGVSGSVVASQRFWSVKRIDPFGEPLTTISDDRMRSRLKAELGRSATTTLLDTRSHSNLLGDVEAGMISSASNRRHAIRAEAQESFGKPLPSKPSRTLQSSSSTGSLMPTNAGSCGGSGGRPGLLEDEDSDFGLSLMAATPADLRKLGLGRDSVAGDVLDGGDRGTNGRGHLSSGHKPHRRRGRRRARRRGTESASGLGDPRKCVSTLAGTNPLSPLPGKALAEAKSFLASSTSIFPMSVNEEMVLEAKDMALKLRQIHDTLQGEVKHKIKRLVDMKRTVEERNSQDAHTMSRTMAGEQVIKALDMRLSKVRSTTSELEKVGTFYTGIIELCVSNPPKDNRHLRALEEQVFLSKQQTTDLSGKVQDLLLQKDAIERLGIDSLRAQLARTKTVRQKVNARVEHLRDQIQRSIKSERRGLNPRAAAKSSEGSLAPREMLAPAGDHPSLPAVGLTALLTSNKLGSGHHAESQMRAVEEKKEYERTEESLEQLMITVGAEDLQDVVNKFKAVQARENDLKKQGEDSSVKIEGLREELQESREILSDLYVVEPEPSSRGSATAGSPNALAGGGETTASSTKNSNLHREQRRLDDLLFQAGIRLAQSTRKAMKAKEEFNDLRVGILHLASLIDSVVRYDQLKGRLLPAQSRVRLLQAQASKAGATLAIGGPEVQPAGSDGGERREEIGGAAAADRGLSTADAETTSAADEMQSAASNMATDTAVKDHPESDREESTCPADSGLVDMFCINKDEDVCKLMEACEARICDVMRDCGFGGDARRGTLLTGSVCEGAPAAQHDFWHSGLNAAIVQEGNEASAEGIDTPSVLHRLFMGQTKGLKNDGAGMDVRVFPPKARDHRFERSMGETLVQQNEQHDMQETEANNLDRNAVATGVASFLGDALNSKSANKHLRRANMLVMGKQGKRAGFGLVMDDVLNGADIDIYGLADATRRRANGLGKTAHADGIIFSRSDLSTSVRDRLDLKASAHATSCRRKQEGRKKALLKKRRTAGA